jgi:hypothetical protein
MPASSSLLHGAASMAAVFLLLAGPATAGEADYEPDDVHEHGAPYFGEAKDIKGLQPVDNVRIKVQLKGTLRFFIVQTDEEGRFRRNGLGTEVDPANVEYTCEKQGYRTIDISTRRLARDKFAPVEIECLLEKI